MLSVASVGFQFSFYQLYTDLSTGFVDNILAVFFWNLS